MAAMNMFERLRGWKLRDRVNRMFYEIEPLFFHVPAIDPPEFRAAVERALG